MMRVYRIASNLASSLKHVDVTVDSPVFEPNLLVLPCSWTGAEDGGQVHVDPLRPGRIIALWFWWICSHLITWLRDVKCLTNANIRNK